MTGPREVLADHAAGSHAAFTTGVLRTLPRDDDSWITALSGTSGGAVCASLTWSALLDGGPDARTTAATRLERSKLSRNPSAIDHLVEHGQHRGAEFLRDLRHPDADDRTALPSHDIRGRFRDRNWRSLPRGIGPTP